MRISSKDRILQSFKISEPDQLFEFLIKKEVRKSRSAIKSLLTKKQILVNGKIITQFDFELKKNDKVEVMKFDQTKKEIKLKGMTVVYEDDYIIVVDKEAGFLSVATDKERELTAYNVLTNYVRKKKKDARIYVVQRVDREVSGLMMFVKDEDTQMKMQKNWDLFVLKYVYLGVIEGKLATAKGRITSWLTENANYLVFSSPRDNGGLEAITDYETLKSNNLYSLVSFDQVTRRKNQIRAQMKQMNSPIVGDKKYGSKGNPLKRIALHASKLVIKHPATADVMEFEVPIGKSMIQLTNPRQEIKRHEE